MSKVKKCYIFSASPEVNILDVDIEEGSYVICADGGYLAAKRMGITPDVVIGDFDTYKRRITGDFEIITYPCEKDDTDTMLAVKLALERGYKHIVLYGAVGGRLDHTIANIQTLRYILKHEAYGEIISRGNHVLMQGPGVRVYSSMKGYYFSAFAYTEKCTGVTMTGFKYPLKNAEIKSSFPIGISNEVTGKSGVVSVEKGVLLIIFSKDMNQN